MAPWLLIGLVAAGLIKALIPSAWVARWLGGRGLGAIVRGALVGAPLPLCSCSVLPSAISLRRQGASRSATTAYLIATPETGVDSVAVSYALLGPFLTIVRPIAAVLSAVLVGLGVAMLPASKQEGERRSFGGEPGSGDCCGSNPTEAAVSASVHPGPTVPLTVAGGGEVDGGGVLASCGSGSGHASESAVASITSCCDASATMAVEEEQVKSAEGGTCCGSQARQGREGESLAQRLVAGFRYAATQLLDDLKVWLVIGVVLAAAVLTFVGRDSQFLSAWGSGLPAMILMVLVGIPMYICATSSTPVAAALLLAGVSPGTVLVFLLAGPATNVATIGVVRREMGTPAAAMYLGGLGVVSIALGLATDWLVGWIGLDVPEQAAHAHGLVPPWLAGICLVLLVLLAVRPLRRFVLPPRVAQASA